AILAAVNGATLEEMVADYMLSFENYFGVEKGSEQYELIGQTVPDMFKTINGGKKVTNANVQKVAENYLLKTVKITKAQLKDLRQNLQ
ncbi:MAG: protein tyrosine phosphatase, partial [Treponema sp.]|nr:protein tyrosine phosphatase [Treponema sp.]